MLRSRRDADRLRPVEGRDLDLGSLDGLGNGDWQVDLEIAVRALLEDGRWRDSGGHVQIAARPSAVAGLALAGEPDPAAIVNARGDVDAVALGLLRDALAAAGGAGVVDDLALATA